MSRKFESSRREFVIAGVTAATIVPTMAQAAPLGGGELRKWKDQVGTRFDSDGAPLRLVAVEPVGDGRGRPAHARRAFDAIFEIDAAHAPKGDASLSVRNAELGRSQLFLVGGGEVRGGKVRLRAHFN